MKSAYAELVIHKRSRNLREDVYQFLVNNGCPKTAEHSLKVGELARKIAIRFGANQESAEIAGYLHDISAVFPSDQRIEVSRALGIEVLHEEEVFPLIIHQKISKEMARDLFNIYDQEILDAIGCHTTLRKESTLLDRVLFVADKIEWDQPGKPPYLNKITAQLNRSLEHAAFTYIDYLWQQRKNLKVIHRWLKEAYEELKLLIVEDHS